MFNKIEAHHRRVIAPMANGVFIAVRTPVAKARLRVMGQPPHAARRHARNGRHPIDGDGVVPA